MYKFRKIFLILSILILFTASCQNQDSDSAETSVTTKEIIGEDLSFYTNIPLEILYTTDKFWGANNNTDDAMTINYINLSKLCEDKLGFPIKFTKISRPSEGYNAYALYIQSGSSGDLIFPVNFFNTQLKSDCHWGYRCIDDGIYLDLTPYLERFCPQAIINFNMYPQIKDNFIKSGKTYAIYAGMPSITALALLIKNDLLDETDMHIDNINNINALHDFVYNLYQGNEPPLSSNKIWVSCRTLLKYAIYNSGYYLAEFSMNTIFDMDDENFIPLLIEDTKIIDNLYDKFYNFLNHSYFTTGTVVTALDKIDGKQDMILLDWSPDKVRGLSRYTINEHDNIFSKYSIALFEDLKPVVDRFNSFIHVMVPATSAQPEKALIFMQWLMTDKEAADILTFGSQLLSIKHYRFANDGTIIPEKRNTIYGFCNLVANFSDKAFLCGNKDFDIIQKYRDMTYKAQYPVFHQIVDSDNEYHASLSNILYSDPILTQNTKRSNYLGKSVDEMILNPYSNLNVEIIKSGLSEIVDTEEYRELIIEAIHNAVK